MNTLFFNCVNSDHPAFLYQEFRNSLLINGYTGEMMTIGDRITEANYSIILTKEQRKRYILDTTRNTTMRAIPLYCARDIMVKKWDWVIYSDVDVICNGDVNKWINNLDKTKEVLTMEVPSPMISVTLLKNHEINELKRIDDASKNRHPRSTMIAVRGDKVIEFFTAYAMAVSNGDYGSETGLYLALNRGNFEYGYLESVLESKDGVFIHKPKPNQGGIKISIPKTQTETVSRKCCGN